MSNRKAREQRTREKVEKRLQAKSGDGCRLSKLHREGCEAGNLGAAATCRARDALPLLLPEFGTLAFLYRR